MPDARSIIAGGLLRLLADTFVLLYKARHLSWRVNGCVGNSLRAIVRQDHRDLDDAADRIVCRILALERDVPPNYADLVSSSSIAQELVPRSEKEMIKQIVDDHGQILADIDTLEVTLPLQDDPETAVLFNHLTECHKSCSLSLGALIEPDSAVTR